VYTICHAAAAAIPVTVSSSSVTVSEAIKVLDMSLPSYDDVKSYKASVETVKSLSATPSKEPAGSLGKSTRSSSSSSGSSATSSSTSDEVSDSKGGFSVSTFLPSVGKQGPKSSSPPGYDF
jgi:hypothetical protein